MPVNDALEDAAFRLRMRRANSRIRKIPLKSKRVLKTLFPIPLEIAYEKQLLGIVSVMSAIVEKITFPAIPLFIETRNINIPPAARVDQWPEDIDRTMETVRLNTEAVNLDEAALVLLVGTGVNAWNKNQWDKVVRGFFGVTPFQPEFWLNDTLDSFVRENTQLIRKMSDDYIRDVQGIIQRGVRGGESTDTITRRIQKATGTTRNRAKLIAVDQVGKLNGQLAELRQTGLGVSEYIWRDRRDIKVRPTHRRNNGKKFRWDSPPSTGHPGQEVHCRCSPEPVFDEVVEFLQAA